jgi:dephospho-CoA kinase
MLKIGITGGIGVGKSVVCKIFAAIGTAIYDADTRAKWLMTNDKTLIVAIKKAFGENAYIENQINRDFMISQILGSPQTAKELETLVHPAVGRDFAHWITEQKASTKYVLKEAALLYEAGSYKELDKTIVVTADLETRIARVLQRDAHRNRQQIETIIAKQMPDSEKIAKADFVVLNDGTKSLIKQVLEIHQYLCNL